ncbi:MAG: hypothetical protein ACYC27_15555 [Armatimonadota bacterium]
MHYMISQDGKILRFAQDDILRLLNPDDTVPASAAPSSCVGFCDRSNRFNGQKDGRDAVPTFAKATVGKP